MTQARAGAGACSNGTRACAGGGAKTSPSYAETNIIDYVTIDTTGNATDFGDRTSVSKQNAGLNNAGRGVFAGGNVNIIDYIAIDTTGNATDFGDLLQIDRKQNGTSGE